MLDQAPVPNKPKKKRKKNPDRAFRPGAPRSKPLDPSAFSVENLMKLNQAASSPAKKGVLLNSTSTSVSLESELFTPKKTHSTQLLSPSKVTLSTPEKGPLTTYVTTPKGSKLRPSRIIQCDDGTFTLFLSEDKINNESLKIPHIPSKWINKSPIPKVHLNGCIDVEITKKTIKETEALIRARKKEGLPARKVSQNIVMGIAANKALSHAGIKAAPGTMHWVHFVSHMFIGDKSQTAENLGLGTKYANMAMELVNPAIKRLLYKKNAYPAIYLSIIPEFVPGYESLRLLKSLTMVIKDAKGDDYKHKALIKFNMLSLQKVCLTDVLPVRKFIMNKFANNLAKEKENDQFLLNISPAPVLTFKHTAMQKSGPMSPIKLSPPSSIAKKPKKLML